METDSLTIRSKTRPPLLSLLITRILTIVTGEGVPYQRTILKGKNPNTCLGRRIFFSVRDSKTDGKKIFWQNRIPLMVESFGIFERATEGEDVVRQDCVNHKLDVGPSDREAESK